VCDCWSGAEHIAGCILGQAEAIALRGLGEAASDTHPLVAALGGLTCAGMLAPTAGDAEMVDQILYRVLDDLYKAGMIAKPAAGGGS